MSGIEKLMAFLDGSPSCFHAVANLTRRLEEAERGAGEPV